MVHETFNLAQMLLALQCPFGKLTFSDGVSCFASTCLAGLAGLAPGCKEKMSQATWPSYKSWSFPMALRARRCPPEFLLFRMSCIGMILGKNWNVSDVSKSSQKRVSHGFLLSGRQNVIWQTFGKHWQACKREVFHFYILFLLGFMSGLAAGQGSRFMSLGGKGAVPAYALTYLIYSLLFLSSLSSGFLFVCLYV